MLSNIAKGFALLPEAFRQRDVVADWVARAHRAQLVLLLIGGVTIFAMPPLLDWALPRVYPPVRTKVSILGIPALSTSRPDPRLAERREQILLAAWILWLGATALVMVSELPGAFARRRDSQTSGAGRAASTTDTVIDGGTPPQPEGAASSPSASAARMGPANRYRILRELGRGGMGVVYHAEDTVLQREVALKELPLHLGGRGDLADRFRQEARVLAKLAHPGIVQVFDLVEDEGRLWIALEFVRGGTVADAMRFAGGALPWSEVARIGGQIAEGLAYAHAQGVVHRDIKPMNVLVTDTQPPVAKLTDFGLARLAESTEHTQPGSLLGSAKYMSPEQVAGGKADARSDVYALGITLFEMVTGSVPFDGEFAAVLGRHANEPAPDVRTLVAEVPAELATLIASMLEKSPARRPQDAEHVAYALRAMAAGGGPEMREAA